MCTENAYANPCKDLFNATRGYTSQGAPHLIAVKADWQQPHHAYLAFSFVSTGSTSVMDIQGTHFQPTLPPGLDPNAPSLLLQAVPGGFLLQITPKVLCCAVLCWLLCMKFAFG